MALDRLENTVELMVPNWEEPVCLGVESRRCFNVGDGCGLASGTLDKKVDRWLWDESSARCLSLVVASKVGLHKHQALEEVHHCFVPSPEAT